MSRLESRRNFLTSTAAAATALTLGAYANPSPAQESKSPSARLRIAAVGTTGRAGGNLTDLSSQDIVALADVDSNLLDKGAEKFPLARKYRDFRVMLEREAENIDAVLVSPPDHTHAPAAAMAMRLGKHCYCEK